MKTADLTKNQDRVQIVALRVNVCNYDSAIACVAELARRKNGGFVCVSTVHMVMESYDNANYAAQVNAADLITPDGMPLVWMQKLYGNKQASQVRGTTLMMKLFALAESNNLTVGFYGGQRKVLDEISSRLVKDYPKLKISYSFSPPFKALTDAEDAEITENIKNSGTDILFVGLGCPKQERWMAQHKNKLSSVMLGVGAAFDFYAGNVSESPEWMSKFGLEWFYRLLQEPKRLWRRYLILNPRFVWLATLQLLGMKKFD
ncbi:MAG: WecB/TagA/CpsF family glycosyltransferase [Acidobacteriota bacterium]